MTEKEQEISILKGEIIQKILDRKHANTKSDANDELLNELLKFVNDI
jgi:hypothetical protein